MQINCMIVDDEPGARELLQELIQEFDELAVVGSFGDPAEAVAAIRRREPDILFLDVGMPGMNGFDVLNSLEWEHMPVVVFVTAYDEHAVRAFEVAAVDYLLKPVDDQRFEAAVGRAIAAVRTREAPPNAAAAPNGDDAIQRLLEVADQRSAVRSIPVKSGSRIRLLPLDEIEVIEAEGNYVRVHAGKESYRLRESLARLEERLDAQRFARVHRRYIVNLTRVRELEPLFHGEYVLLMASGKRVTSGRMYKDRMREIFDLRS